MLALNHCDDSSHTSLWWRVHEFRLSLASAHPPLGLLGVSANECERVQLSPHGAQADRRHLIFLDPCLLVLVDTLGRVYDLLAILEEAGLMLQAGLQVSVCLLLCLEAVD